MKRSDSALCVALLFATAGCHTMPTVRPIEIDDRVRSDYETASALREQAQRIAREELGAPEVEVRVRTKREEALALARRAKAAAPDEFRLSCLVQDLEFELDARAAREQYTAADATAAEKTLAARALLPERSSDARDLLASACEQEPGFAWARYGLAYVERELGRTDAALRDAMAALELEPSLLEALRLVAALAESGGAREQALWARRELVAATGGEIDERSRYARLLLESDAKRDASAAEGELVAIANSIGEPPPPALRDDLRDTYVNLGAAYARRNRFDEAILHWRHALELDPECLTALANIGLVQQDRGFDHEKRGKVGEAAAAFAVSLSAFEEYLRRAQSLSSPLASDEVYYRQFFVPNQVLLLRQKLGLPTEASEPIEPSDLGPSWPEAGR